MVVVLLVRAELGTRRRTGGPCCAAMPGGDAPTPAATNRTAACCCSAELATGDNSDLHLTVAVSYSGRQDVTLAVQEIARLAAGGELRPADVTPALIEQHLATRQLPHAWRHPDLLIRTSGERRLSNFLTWECAYSGGCPRGAPALQCSCDGWLGLCVGGQRGTAAAARSWLPPG